MHSLKYNAFINILSKVTSVLFPLITIPYITHTLTVENYGMVALSQNIISFFSLFAGLGIQTYAARSGAAIRDNKEKITRFACEIFSINVISTICSLVGLALCIIFISNLHPLLSLLTVMSFGIMMSTIGCDWVNNIYEDFTSLTIRTILVQIVSLILLFLLVTQPDDQLIYASIGVFASGGASLINAFYIRKYVKISLIRCTWSIINRHVRPILIFFFTQVAIMLYVSSDAIMVGFMRSAEEVAYYNIAVKVYSIVNSFIYAIILVLLPRLSHDIHTLEDLIRNNQKINYIFSVMVIVTIPMIALLCSLSSSIVMFLGGTSYEEAILPLKILSFATFFAVFAGLYSACILLPLKFEKISFYNTVAAALVNVVLNFMFIPYFGIIAAAGTTVIAEAVGLGCYWYHARKLIRISIHHNIIFLSVIGYLTISFISLIAENVISNALVQCIIAATVSMIVYLGLIYLFKKDIFYSLLGNKIYALKKRLRS